MKRYLFTLMLISGALYACNCAIGRDMIKCDYYVGKKFDKTHQKECLDYASSINKDGMYAKASWYYLLGGDIKNAKINAKKALKIGHHYAAEYLGMVYILEHDIKSAKKEFSFFKNKVKQNQYIKKDVNILKHIYSNFNDKEVLQMLKD